MTTTALFGSPVSTYTREQAIEDGVLMILPTEIRNEAGIRFPTAMTSKLFDLVNPTSDERAHGQTQDGRLWDLTWMLRCAMKQHQGGDTAQFSCVFLVCNDRDDSDDLCQRTTTLSVHVGPGDTPEPVLTVELVEATDEPLYTEPFGV